MATAGAAKALVAPTAAALAATTAGKVGAATLGEALCGLQAFHHLGLELLAAVALDVKDLAAVAELGKGHGQAVAAGAAGAADAVRVVLGLHRQTEIEDMGDGGHVDAACGHVGGHQDLHLAIAQRHQAAVAQALAQSAMQRHGAEAILLQVIRQAVALHLGAGKHDGLVDGSVAQPVVQELPLVLGVVGPEQLLLDVGMLLLRRVDLDLLHAGAAIVHHAHGQLLDARRKGGAEHHGLLALGRQLIDLGQVVGETQIQHAIGLVHNQELHLVQLDLLRALQIQQAARRGHHQVGVLQLGDLHLVGHAAHHVGDAQALAMLDQVDGVMRHLLRQLARGAQHQGAGHGGLEVARLHGVLALGALGGRLATCRGLKSGALILGTLRGLGLGLLAQQRVQHGQQEGRGLAAAGLAGDHQVDEAAVLGAGAHGQGNGLVLHGRGLGVAQVGHGLHQLGRQAQLDKAIGQGCLGRCIGRGNNGFGRRALALQQNLLSHDLLTRRRPQALPGQASLDGYKTSTIKRNQGPQRTTRVGIGCKAPRGCHAGVQCPMCEGRCTKKLHRALGGASGEL